MSALRDARRGARSTLGRVPGSPRTHPRADLRTNPGAWTHLVRRSRCGASVRPTIARFETGRRGHSPGERCGNTVRPCRNATNRDKPGASVTGRETDRRPARGATRAVGGQHPDLDHEPNNRSSASRPGSRNGCPHHYSANKRIAPRYRGAIFVFGSRPGARGWRRVPARGDTAGRVTARRRRCGSIRAADEADRAAAARSHDDGG
jgi:hypothetical protein